MESGIYAIRNTINGKLYIGSAKNFHKRKLEHFRRLRKKEHFNIRLQRSVNKHGIGNFEFIILERAEYSMLIKDLEDSWINKLNSKASGYNIADATFGDILSSHPNKENIKRKISAGLLKLSASMTPEQRKIKYGKSGELNPMYGRAMPDYVKSAAAEGIKKFVVQHGHGPTKGIKKTTVHREKLSIIAKARVGELNPFYGRRHSEEAIQKMSERATGRRCSTLRPVVVYGIIYERLIDAEKATGIKVCTLHHRAKSKNPKFNYIYHLDNPKS